MDKSKNNNSETEKKKIPPSNNIQTPLNSSKNIPTNENKGQNIKNFVIFVFLLVMGYKIYYFNLNLEYYFKNIDYNITDNIFLRGGNVNKLSEETFKSFFGSEITQSLTDNLKHTHKGWFDNYHYNLKLDFSYYFLKLMNAINKLKLTRYLWLSLFTGSFLFTGVMFILFFITCFFTIYGLIRVFTMELPYFIFAILTPFILMYLISAFMIIYYSIKLLFMKTRHPNGEEHPNLDKLVIISMVCSYISNRVPIISNKFKFIKTIIMLLSLVFPIYYTKKYDFFFKKDWEVIKEIFNNNKANIMYLGLFILCIFLFAKYS